MSCVECGTCSYNCPGQVPIVQYIRKTKTHINNAKRAQQAALAASKKDTAPIPVPAVSVSAAKEMKMPEIKTTNKEEAEK